MCLSGTQCFALHVTAPPPIPGEEGDRGWQTPGWVQSTASWGVWGKTILSGFHLFSCCGSVKPGNRASPATQNFSQPNSNQTTLKLGDSANLERLATLTLLRSVYQFKSFPKMPLASKLHSPIWVLKGTLPLQCEVCAHEWGFGFWRLWDEPISNKAHPEEFWFSSWHAQKLPPLPRWGLWKVAAGFWRFYFCIHPVSGVFMHFPAHSMRWVQMSNLWWIRWFSCFCPSSFFDKMSGPLHGPVWEGKRVWRKFGCLPLFLLCWAGTNHQTNAYAVDRAPAGFRIPWQVLMPWGLATR